jgi:hypothetical protein
LKTFRNPKRFTVSEHLERRLANALCCDGVTSAILTSLINEADAAIADADAAVEKERKRAMDPTLSPDLRKARAALEDAEFAANRLRSLQPRLQKRLAHIEYTETHARWLETYEAVKAKRDAAAENLKAVYPEVVAKLVELLARIRAVDAEVRRVNASKPTALGEPWDGNMPLDATECAARSVTGFNSPDYSLDRGVRLPDFEHPGKNSWPPHEPLWV